MNKICHADISYLFCFETNTKNQTNQSQNYCSLQRIAVSQNNILGAQRLVIKV